MGRAVPYSANKRSGLTTRLNMTDNVLSTLESRVSPEAMNAPKQDGFKVGKSTNAVSLLETFSKEAFDTTRLDCLRSMTTLTTAEFKEAIKTALEMATTQDSLSGFVAPEGAKGQENYGPVRRVLSQRLSEAKSLFGVLKMDSSVLANKGYHNALTAARAFLADKQVKWDGTSIPTDQQKDAKEARKALEQVMGSLSQEAGESMASYMARCADRVPEALEEAKAKAHEAFLVKLTAKLTKDHGESILADLFSFLVDTADLESLNTMQAYFEDARLVAQLEAAKIAEPAE